MSATIKELLMAAEYIAAKGNFKIMLCERGIRTFEPMTRNTLDLGAVAMLKELTHLPVIVDPSHGIGVRSGVTPLARAGIAVGADGLIVEMHPDPSQAWSDGMQSLTVPMFQSMMEQVKKISAAVDRGI
jgi:3-deoxy-7-phosphoheptulonate synthase